MANMNTASPQGIGDHHGKDTMTPPEDPSHVNKSDAPHSLRDALQSAGGGDVTTPTDSTSEEDYDDKFNKPVAVLMSTGNGRAKRPALPNHLPRSGSGLKTTLQNSDLSTPSDVSWEAGHLADLSIPRGTKLYAVESDDKELRAILKRGMQRVSIPHHNPKSQLIANRS